MEQYSCFISQRGIRSLCTAPGIDNGMPRNLFLEATGLLHNATTSYVTSSDIQLLPELHGVQRVELGTPQLILPDTIPIATEHEVQQLLDIAPAEIQKLDELRSRLAAPRRTYDVDSLLHVQQTTQSQATQTHRFMIIFLSLCTAIVLGILCYLIYPHLCIKRYTPPNLTPKTPQRTFHRNQMNRKAANKIRMCFSLRTLYNEPANREDLSTRHETATFREMRNLHFTPDVNTRLIYLHPKATRSMQLRQTSVTTHH